MLLAGVSPTQALAANQKKTLTTKSPSRTDVVEKQGNLKQLRGQIEELRKDTRQTEDQRSATQAKLKAVEADIAATERELQSLIFQQSRLQETLRDLAQQTRTLETRITHQQSQLESLVYRQYLQGNPDSLRLLLNGDNPNQTARDLYYLAAIGQARSELLGEIGASLKHKQALASDAHERAADLAAIENRQKSERDKLVDQREQREALLARLSNKLVDQKRQLGSLQRDEKQLTSLIDRLTREIAARAKAKPPVRKEKQTAERARQSSDAYPNPKATAAPPTREPTKESPPVAVPSNARLPVHGAVTNRFGSPRQEGGSWKGLFIRASQGSEVRAAASGRVVFADTMRGFGNLLIVDHGSGYLSVYGNNDRLLKQEGDTVSGGDVIAAVGSSGSSGESGLYFELRYRGQPIDPLKWIGAR